MNTNDPPPDNATPEQAREEALKMSEQARHAAALAALQDEENAFPPVLVLGYRGEKCVYYSRTYRREFAFKLSEHTKGCLLALAPKSELRKWRFPEREESKPPTDRELAAELDEYLKDASGRKGEYKLDTMRGAGCWLTKEGVIYNAGTACFLAAPDGTIKRVCNIRAAGKDVTIYASRAPLPYPAAAPLTDEEGKAVKRFFTGRAWVQEWAADIMTGWTVCALLGEVLPMRPHVWINAPSNTGKTEMKKDYCTMLGALPVVLESVKTTEAACRADLEGGTRPVLADEADTDASKINQVSAMQSIIELARSATYGGIIKKGTPDGGIKAFYIASPFLLFSIRNVLSKEEDLNRFAMLEMRQMPPGQELNEMLAKYQAAAAEITAPNYCNKFITRVLSNAYRLKEIFAELTAYIRAQGIAARTSEYSACVMAGQWILTESGPITDAYKKRAAYIARKMTEANQDDKEEMRALMLLLGYRPKDSTSTIEQLARAVVLDESNKTARERLEGCNMKVSYYSGKKAEKDTRYLIVLQASLTMREIYERTTWNAGRDGIGKTLSRLDGVLYGDDIKARVIKGGSAMRCILIPQKYWNGDEW